MTGKGFFIILAFCVSLLLVPPGLFAVELKWDIPRGERLEIVKTAVVKYFSDSRLQKQYDERNIVNLTCYDRDDNKSLVRGNFSIFQRDSSDRVFEAGSLLEKHESDFGVLRNGRFEVKPGDYMPNLRHIPTFPGGPVEKGDSWKGEGEIHINGFSVPLKLSFPVEYRFDGMEKGADGEYAVVRYKYDFNSAFPDRGHPDFPVRVTGADEGVIFWDTAANGPVQMKEMKDKYRIVFFFQDPDGFGPPATREFRMDIATMYKTYMEINDADRAKARDDLAKHIPKESGIDVDTDTRGLVVRLGDVLFDFDSFDLKRDARETLGGIGDIIRKQYPDHELIVEGHTDNVGGDAYNQKLSEERADTVARYMRSRVGHDKISYRGFGEKNPITGNDTADGRRKNRRVDIIIKMK